MTWTAIKQVVCASLVFYCGGIFVLALWPTNHITAVEWICAGLAVVAAFGLVAMAIEQIQVPGERYAFLVCGLAGATTLILYLLDVRTDEAVYLQARITLLLLAGVVGSYGAWWVQETPEAH